MHFSTMAFAPSAPVTSTWRPATSFRFKCRGRQSAPPRPGPTFGKRCVMTLAPNSAQGDFVTDDSAAGVNAGEAYMAQLAKQSSQRKSAEGNPATGKPAADAYMESPNGLSGAISAQGEHVSDEYSEPLNAGDRYMAQLARQTALNKSASRLQERNVLDFDGDTQGQNAGEDNIAQLAKQSASKASNFAPQSVAREIPPPVANEDDPASSAIDKEIARLKAEVAALESALGTAKNTEEVENSIKDQSVRRLDQLEESEVIPGEGVHDGPVALSDGVTVQDLDSYSSMREMLSDHVAPPSAAQGNPDVETLSFEEVSAENTRKSVNADRDVRSKISAIEDAKSSELAMVEIQLEMERYKVAARNLLEKHEQHIQTIIEKYMPGL